MFVHCADFFEYDGNTNSCVLSSDIVEEIQDICEAQVKQLQYAYGDQECNESISTDRIAPTLNINQLFDEVENNVKKVHYQK